MILYLVSALFLLNLSKADDVQSFSNITRNERNGKALSIFQVVKFPNIGCSGSSSYNGTCYTASECTNKGGTSAGSCASGFGVCCTFTLGCGSTISENCTYFVSTSPVLAGQCSVQICECSSDVCQLRLDFNTFVITGPSTVTITQFVTVNGGSASTNAAANGVSSNFATKCLTDSFSVTGNNAAPPVICGTNTGYHMYVDSSSACNTLAFQMNPTGIGATLASRSWNIKVTQISCYSQSLAPQGCTQYFTGTSGTISSYNYGATTPQQLANQQQQICFRRERGYCRLCLTPSTATSTDFQISGTNMGSVGTSCCGYGTKGVGAKGYDCVVIPGAMIPAGIAINNQICGAFFGTAAAISSTVCTSLQPFSIQFLTDASTVAIAITAKSGFRLNWFLTTC